MKTIILLLISILLFIPLVIAPLYDNCEIYGNCKPIKTGVTSSIIANGTSSNDTYYFQGYTPTTLKDWIQGLFDLVYQPIGNYLTTVNNTNINVSSIISVGNITGDKHIFPTSNVMITNGTADWLWLRNLGNTADKSLRVYNLYATNLIEMAPNVKLLLGYYPFTDKWITYESNTEWIELMVNSSNKGWKFVNGTSINITHANIDLTNNITANKFIGNGSLLTNVPSNINGTNINVLGINATSQTINGNLNQVNGNATINGIYGGMWYSNYTATNLNFAVSGTFYPLFFTHATHLNGFGAEGLGHLNQSSNLTTQIAGVYLANYMASGDGQNNHEYHTSIFINSVNQLNCDSQHKMAAGGDVITQTGTCLINLNVGDKVSLRTADIGSTGTGNYYGANLDLVRIAN